MSPFVFHIDYDFSVRSDLVSVTFAPTDGDVPFFRREGDGRFAVFLPTTYDLRSPRVQQFANTVLERLLRERAMQVIPPMVKEITAHFDIRFHRISIKNISSRWGSCSGLGNLNFSLWLMLTSRSLTHYVVCHELAHLDEMNHGPRFWARVDKLLSHNAPFTPGRGKALEREINTWSRSFSRRLVEQRRRGGAL